MPASEDILALRWGRYRPLRELGAGGMATVYLAEQTSELGFQRQVAIKRMHPHLAKDLSYVEMFLDEAKVLTSLVHPHIVPLLDVVSKDGELLLVMDFVPGLTMDQLEAALREDEERIPPPIAVRIACDFLEGLHAAHTARNPEDAPLSVVHRDVSPHNVLVGRDGRSRIFDFGVAKSAAKRHLTEAGKVRGKARYMAPEQLLGEDVDARADVYAAGVTLWEFLVGRPAFRGNSEAAIATNVLSGGLLAPHEVAPEIPRALGDCIFRACSPKKTDRFESAIAFAEALELAVAPASHRKVAEFVRTRAEQIHSPRASLPEGVLSRTSDGAESTQKTRGGGRLVLFGVLALAVIALGFLLLENKAARESPRLTDPKPNERGTSLPSASPANETPPSLVPSSPASPAPRSASSGTPLGPSTKKEKATPTKKPAPVPSTKPIDDLFGQH